MAVMTGGVSFSQSPTRYVIPPAYARGLPTAPALGHAVPSDAVFAPGGRSPVKTPRRSRAASRFSSRSGHGTETSPPKMLHSTAPRLAAAPCGRATPDRAACVQPRPCSIPQESRSKGLLHLRQEQERQRKRHRLSTQTADAYSGLQNRNPDHPGRTGHRARLRRSRSPALPPKNPLRPACVDTARPPLPNCSPRGRSTLGFRI